MHLAGVAPFVNGPRGLQIGFLGPAFFLSQLGRVTTPRGAVLCMMASQGCDAFSSSGLYSNHQARPPCCSRLVQSTWPGTWARPGLWP